MRTARSLMRMQGTGCGRGAPRGIAYPQVPCVKIRPSERGVGFAEGSPATEGGLGRRRSGSPHRRHSDGAAPGGSGVHCLYCRVRRPERPHQRGASSPKSRSDLPSRERGRGRHAGSGVPGLTGAGSPIFEGWKLLRSRWEGTVGSPGTSSGVRHACRERPCGIPRILVTE